MLIFGHKGQPFQCLINYYYLVDYIRTFYFENKTLIQYQNGVINKYTDTYGPNHYLKSVSHSMREQSVCVMWAVHRESVYSIVHSHWQGLERTMLPRYHSTTMQIRILKHLQEPHQEAYFTDRDFTYVYCITSIYLCCFHALSSPCSASYK